MTRNSIESVKSYESDLWSSLVKFTISFVKLKVTYPKLEIELT